MIADHSRILSVGLATEGGELIRHYRQRDGDDPDRPEPPMAVTERLEEEVARAAEFEHDHVRVTARARGALRPAHSRCRHPCRKRSSWRWVADGVPGTQGQRDRIGI